VALLLGDQGGFVARGRITAAANGNMGEAQLEPGKVRIVNALLADFCCSEYQRQGH